MPPTTPCSGSVRPDAAAVNAAIRTFLCARRGRELTAAERVVYEGLRAEWVAAVRRDRYGTAA